MIPDQEKNAIWDEIERGSTDLIDAFLAFKNREECKACARDIMSERDLREFAMRWEIAKMLDAGMSFTQIQENGMAAKWFLPIQSRR